MTDQYQMLPHDKEAEIGVLGSVLHDPWMLLQVKQILPDSTAFFSPGHRVVYDSILRLDSAGEPFDEITVVADLRKHRQLEAYGTAAGIAEMLDLVPNFSDAPAYARIVRDEAKKRAIIEKALELSKEAMSTEKTSTELAADASEGFGEISRDVLGESVVAVRDAATRLFEWIEEATESEGKDPLPVKIGNYWDGLIGGLMPGYLHIVGARMKVGKSMFLMNSVQRNAANGIPALVFSLEMRPQDLVGRMICSHARINGQKLLTGRVEDFNADEWDRIALAHSEIGGMPIHFAEGRGGKTTDDISSISRLMVEQEGIQLIVVDHLTLIKASGKTEVDRQTHRIDRLRELAERLNVPILVAVQLNRAGDDRPTLKDFAWSDAIGQHCYTAFLLHRPEKGDQPWMQVELAAQRNGVTGFKNLTFDPQWYKIGPHLYKEWANEQS